MKNEKITLRSEDFAKWYTDVVKAANLCDYSSVKGCTILEPNGYAIWEKMQSVIDGMFKKTNHQNVYLPVFIPESLLKKEGELIEEVVVAKIATTTDALDAMKKTVVDAVCSLSAVSEENSASTEETTASMEELNVVITQATDSTKAVDSKAKELKELVNVFKV